MDLYQIWRCGKVNRMHTAPQLIRENTAEHTWGVQLLALKYYPSARAEFKDYITLHDFGESKAGDVPGNLKWADPNLKAVIEKAEHERIEEAGFILPILTPSEEALMEILDRAEFCISCIHEIRSGNVNAMEYFGRSSARVLELISKMPDQGEGVDLVMSVTGPYSPEKYAALKLRDDMRQLVHSYLDHVPNLYGAKNALGK